MIHSPVLLHETIEGLLLKDGDTIVDATLGNGGHSEAFLSSGKDVRVIAIDLDRDAIARSQARLSQFGDRITYILGSFRDLRAIALKSGLEKVDKILFDFGLSSNQLEESGRGFTFQKDEPLLMTFSAPGEELKLSARDVVNEWGEDSLREIIRGFGEERFAGRIARAIVSARERKSIETTGELVDIILSTTPAYYHRGKIHPATRTFQAIRIAVNDELRVIEDGLRQGFDLLSPHGRIAAISFHSLEDRLVKRYFRELAASGRASVITKKPVIATEDEMSQNPRSRSAKLRIIEKQP